MSSQTVPPGATSVSDESRQRQAEALEISGWGERFRFYQPHNLCFWVYIALTAIGTLQAWSYFAPTAGFYADAFALSAVLSTLFGLAWLLWFRHIDRWERQPVGLVVAALVWGAVPATFGFAMTVNNAMLSIYGKVFGQEWADNWAAGATAPITEESAKLCGFILIMGLAPRLVRTANDGLIIGAFVGLGFAAFEDFLYDVNATGMAFGTDPVGSSLRVAATRTATGFVSHPLFSALVCCGVIYLIGTVAQPRRSGRGVALVLSGMFLHFVWDDATGLGMGNGALTLLAMGLSVVIAFVVLSLAFRGAAPREHQFVRDILAPEVEVGTLTAAEVEAVVDKSARRHLKKSAPDHRAKRARKHLRRAVLDLTHDVAESRGSASPEVAHARAEVARLRSTARLLEPAPRV